MIAPIGTEPLKESGTDIRNGLADVPLPISVASCKTDEPPLASIVPATVSFEVGVSVPIPTFPNLSSKMIVSPMNELLPVCPVHFANLPAIPLPRTGRLGPADIGITFADEAGLGFMRVLPGGISEKPADAIKSLNLGFMLP